MDKLKNTWQDFLNNIGKTATIEKVVNKTKDLILAQEIMSETVPEHDIASNKIEIKENVLEIRLFLLEEISLDLDSEVIYESIRKEVLEDLVYEKVGKK